MATVHCSTMYQDTSADKQSSFWLHEKHNPTNQQHDNSQTSIQNIRATVTSYKASEKKTFAVPPPQDILGIESIDMPHNIATMQML
jgi:hypothetical protein